MGAAPARVVALSESHSSVYGHIPVRVCALHAPSQDAHAATIIHRAPRRAGSTQCSKTTTTPGLRLPIDAPQRAAQACLAYSGRGWRPHVHCQSYVLHGRRARRVAVQAVSAPSHHQLGRRQLGGSKHRLGHCRWWRPGARSCPCPLRIPFSHQSCSAANCPASHRPCTLPFCKPCPDHRRHSSPGHSQRATHPTHCSQHGQLAVPAALLTQGWARHLLRATPWPPGDSCSPASFHPVSPASHWPDFKATCPCFARCQDLTPGCCHRRSSGSKGCRSGRACTG
mmetsp:Transcript_6608/g.17719  ORF Transcript_6608/g.17719 Transcript_6608/m.17719 type:complete len:283 (-) Transcript_6608:1582-2430(-)